MSQLKIILRSSRYEFIVYAIQFPFSTPPLNPFSQNIPNSDLIHSPLMLHNISLLADGFCYNQSIHSLLQPMPIILLYFLLLMIESINLICSMQENTFDLF